MRVCAKNVGGAYARGGAYLRDTTVLVIAITSTVTTVVYVTRTVSKILPE